MAHRSPARWLAPIALLAALAAVGLVYQSTTGDETSSAQTSTTPRKSAKGDGKASTATTSRTTTAQADGAGPRTYRVKPGDTLGGIAETTGVSIEQLQELNPELDASSLSVGQSVRLRR